MKNSNGMTKTIGLVALSVLAGATIGVLFAPKKGSETRNLLTGKLTDSSKKMSKKIEKQSKKLNKQLQKDTKYLNKKALEYNNLIDDKLKKEKPLYLSNTNVLLPENYE